MGGVASGDQEADTSVVQARRGATNAGLFLEGLLGDEQRKTGWMRAEAAGDPGPWRQQAILGRMDWDADALRDIVRDYVMRTSVQVIGVKVPVASTTPRAPPTLQSFSPAPVPAGGASSGGNSSDPSASNAKMVAPSEST